MVLRQNQELVSLTEQEKQNITTDLGEFERFLAYARDDGAGLTFEEPERRGIRKLKGTPVWAALYPARQGYHAARYLYQNGVSGIYKKAQNAAANSRYVKRKEARKFLTKIMPTCEEKEKQSARVFEADIKISVLVPLYNTPEKFLRDMIGSVTGQTYPNWELCLADASDSAHKYVADIVRAYARQEPRIVYQKLEKNEGIAGNTNECIRMASGNYLALFDHDDMLHPSALYECARVIEREGAQFVYTDEVTFEGENLEDIVTYHFKPDFSVDNLRGVNYICHLSVFEKRLMDQVGMFREEYDGSQDHDMILRLTDAAEKVCHIPKVLYFWRRHNLSTSMNLDAKDYAVEAGRRAVADAEMHRGYPAKVYSAHICRTHYRMNYQIGTPRILVLINGVGKSKRQVAHTAASVEKISSYQNYELLYAMDQKELSEAICHANGQYLFLLDAGTELITPGCMEELLMFAQREDVGLAGMQALDEKNFIVSSDLVIADRGDTLAVEINRGVRYDATGYMGRNYYAHNVSAVSGCACMGKKEALACLWEKAKADSFFGRMLEVCFLLRGEEKQIVLNPYALCRIRRADFGGELSASDLHRLRETYQKQIEAGDPFYNKNLSLERHWEKKA